jgi:hypothetical protein
MPQFLLTHQGMLENFGIILIIASLAWLVFYVWPRYRGGLQEDPLRGTRYARNPRD